MKSFKIFAMAAMMATVLFSCNNNPEKVLPKQEGRWLIENTTSITTIGGTTTEETSSNDGFLVFEDDGTGYSTDMDGENRSDFNWTSDDDQLTISDDSSSTTVTILEISRDEFTTFYEVSGEILGTTFDSEITTEFERVDD